MNEQELKNYHEIFTDCWKLFKKYSNPVDNDEFWMQLKDDAQKIVDKNNNSKFCRDITKSIILEIHRLWRAGDNTE